MANVMYDSGASSFAQAGINWVSDTIKAICIDTANYTFSQSHTNLSQVAAGSRIAVGQLANKAILSNGSCDADDLVMTNITGASVEAIIIYKHTGTESTSTLIAYLDTLTGLPFTPLGVDVTLRWGSNGYGIFRL